MSEFHFLRPLWLLALPAVAALVIRLLRSSPGSRSWAAVCDPQLLPFLLVGNTQRRGRRLAPWLIGGAGTLLVIALAGPSWERLPQPVFRDQSALVIALDLSRSMDAADLKPSRLARASHKITDILRARQAGQTALLVYAGEAFTVTPLTDDRDTILAQLPSLDSALMPVQGSRADLAVEAAAGLLQQAGAARGQVLLITDGIETDALAGPLQRLRTQGHRLSILGVGTPEGAPIPMPGGGFVKDARGAIVVPRLDGPSLREWAQKAGGRYAAIRADEQDIRYLLDEPAARGMDHARQAAGFETDQWREQGPWLILLVIPLAALAFRRGLWVLLPALLIPVPDAAQALDWDGLWRTPDQQGMRAFEQGDPQGAAQRFADPQWKAAAEYRAGRYQQAASTLADIETPDALYNRGNALAKLGQIPEAMASYQRALELDPQHEDARHNLELLQQQQQQQQQQQNADSSQEGNSDSAEQQQGGQDASGTGEQSQGGQQENTSGAPSSSQAEAGDDAPSEDGQSSAEPSAQAQSPQTQGTQQPSDQTQRTDPEGMTAGLQQEAEQASDPATEQWLRRIPDDPGGLLRRKFLYQYQQRERRSNTEEKPW